MIDLTPVFQAVIALLAALITYKLIPWIKARTTKQTQENLYAAARIAVYAAEQIFGAGQGDQKLEYAMDALKKAGYNIDTQLVRESVEDVVHGMTDAQVFFGVPPDDEDVDAEKEAPEEAPEEAE